MRTSKNGKALKLISSAQITLSKIYDAYTINLSNSNFDIVCNDQGDALAGEIGTNGRAITTTSVVVGAKKLTAVASNPTAEQYCISISAQVGCTAAKNGNDKVYVNTLSNSIAGKISISFNIEGTTTVVKDVTFVKKMNDSPNFIDGQFSFGTGYWSTTQDGTGVLGSNVTIKKSNESIYGTNLLEIANETWFYSKKNINIEKDRIYRCRFRAKQSIDNTTGGKIAYFGYTPYNSSGTAIGTNGANNMYFKNEALKTNAWTEWEYYVSTKARAEVSTTVNGVKKVITPAVQAFPTGAVKFQPMFIINYQKGNGIALADGWILEDVTEQFEISQLEYKASQIETTVNGIDANVTTIKTYTEMSSNPMSLVAKPNYSAYNTPDQGEIYLHGLNDNRNPADIDGKCIWNKKPIVLPKTMYNPNGVVPDGIPIYMVRNISGNSWWSMWKETSSAGVESWKRVRADVNQDRTIYSQTWNETNDVVVGYYIVKKTTPKNGEAPILTAQLFDGALNYKQATSMTLVGSISQLEILENEVNLKVANTDNKVSQLKLDADKITQRVQSAETNITTVSTNLNNLQIGGKNLLKDSDFIVQATSSAFAPTKTISFVNGLDLNVALLNKTVTFSYYVHCPGDRTSGSESLGNRFGIHGSIQWKNSSTGATKIDYPFADCLTGSYNKQRVAMTISLKPPSGYDIISNFVFAFQPLAKPNSSEVWKIGQPKLEIGNKATDWTPAPEDVDSAIANVNTKVESTTSKLSELKLETDKITQRVQSTESNVSTITHNFNNMQIGGSNILRGTNTISQLGNSCSWSAGTWRGASGGTGTREVINIDNAPNPNIKKGVRITTTSSTSGHTDIAQDNVPVINGVTYTMSCYARKTNGNSTLRLQYGKSPYPVKSIVISTTTWQKYYYTFTVGQVSDGSTAGSTNIYFGLAPGMVGSVEICGFQLERGNKITDWQPAPEDVNTSIANVDSKAESTKNKVAEIETTLDGINLKVQSTEKTVTNHTTQLNQVDGKVNTVTNNFNNLQIGGRNLMPNTNFYNGTNGWGVWNSAHSMSVVTGRFPNTKALQIVLANQAGSGYKTSTVPCIGGKQYTVSFWFKTTIACQVGDLIKILNSNGSESNPIGMQMKSVKANEWTHYSFTFTTPSTAVKIYTTPRIEPAVGTPTVQLTEYMLEESTKASSWSPAPEDIDSSITNVNTKVEATTSKLSQLKLDTDKITQRVQSTETNITTVSNNLNNLQIGGRNLLVKNCLENGNLSGVDGTIIAGATNFYRTKNFIDIDNSSKYTLKVNKGTSGDGIEKIIAYNSNGTYISTQYVNAKQAVYTPPVNCTKIKFIVVIANANASTIIESFKIQLEKGTKATDWTAAPEDIDNAIASVDNKVISTNNKVASIETNLSGITQKVSATETKVNSVTTSFNNLQVGGKNLILDTSTPVINSSWSSNGWSGSISAHSTNTYKLIAINGWRVHKYKLPSDYVGKTITISFYAKLVSSETTSTTINKISVCNATGTNPYPSSEFTMVGNTGTSDLPVKDTWIYCYSTVVLNADAQIGIGVRCTPESQNLKTTWLVKDLKVEIGNKATDWTPAPEDINKSIANVDNKVISTNSKVASIETNLSGITQKVSSTETKVNSITTSFNNLQIGGRNLFLKSDINKYGVGCWERNGSGVGIVEGTYIDETKTMKLTGNEGIRYNPYIKLKRNTTYTYSMMMKSSGAIAMSNSTPLHMWLKTATDSENSHLETIISKSGSIPANVWTKVWISFKTPNSQDTYYMKPFVYGISSNTVYITKVKVEEGEKATDWSPAPEDIDSAITSVDNKVTTTNSKVATIETNLSSITQRVSSTETTTSTLTTNMNNKEDKNNRVIYARGAGNDYPGHRILKIGNTTIYSTGGRGARVTALVPSTLAVYSDNTYDLHVGGDQETNFINKINELNNGDYIIVVTSCDNAYLHYRLRCEALYKIGGFAPNTSLTGYREAYALIGRSKLGKGNGVEMYIPKTETDKRFAEVSVKVNDDGAFMGVNSSNIGHQLDTVDSKVETTKQQVSEISTSLNGITLKVQSTEQTVANHTTQLNQVDNKVSNAINNLQIGGRNFAIGTDFKKDTAKWECYNGATINKDTGKAILVANGKDCRIAQTLSQRLEPSTMYTLSARFKDSGTTGGNGLRLYISINNSWQHKAIPSKADGVYSYTFTTPSSITHDVQISIDSYNTTSGSGTCEVWNIKLEKGSKATDWSPAPEDTDNAINNAVDNITIGGRNIATETNRGVTGWNWAMSVGGRSITEVVENGIKCCKMVRDNVAATGWSYISYSRIGRNKYVAGRTYTVSFEVKSSVPTSFWCHFLEGNSSNGMHTAGAKATVSETNKWTKLVFTLTMKDTLPTSTSQLLYLNSMDSSVGVTYIFRNLMIEEGTKASAWSPAPEDIDSSIANVNTKVDTSMSQIEMLNNKIGLKVEKNNVIASINLYTQTNENGSSSGIKIKGDKVDLQGQVTFSSLADSNASGSIKNIFTQQNNQTVINGGMIKTQTIKGNDLLLKGNLTVTDSGNNKTFEITSNGDVNIQAKSLRIGSANVATNNDISNAVNNLQIGGKNLLKDSDFIVQATSSAVAPTKTISFVNGLDLNVALLNKTVTFSYYVHCPGDRTNGSGSLGNRFGIHGSIQWKNSSTGATRVDYPFADCLTGSYNKQRVAMTISLKPPSGFDIISSFSFSFQPLAKPNSSEVWKIGQPKLEIGNKATDWTPAPEDTIAAINSKVNNTQEAIFNKLFANGQQGFVLESGKVYINGEVIKANVISGTAIKAGTLDASKIKAGIIQASAGGSYLDLNNGSMMLGTTSLSNYLQWTGSQLNIKANSISIGSSALATTTDINNAIKNVQIGGRNLILNSALNGNSNWTGTVSIDTSKKCGNCNSLKFTGSASAYSNSIPAKVGDVFTVSVKSFVGTSGGSLPLIIFEEYKDNTTNRINYQETTVSSTLNSWQDYAQTWTVKNAETTNVRIRIYNRTASYNFWASQPKLEKGNKATDWTPASEDIESSINGKVNNTQEAIFNKLFSNGQQGFVLENGKVYINGEVIKANAIRGSVISAINMSSESATINSAQIGNLDASKITTGFISANRLDASTLVSKINGGYTSISGNKIRTGIIRANSGGSYIDLDDGTMQLGTTSKSNYLQWNGSTLTIKGHLNTCTFRGKNMVYIEDNGTLSCDGQTYIRHLSVLETHPGWASGTRGSFDCAPTANFAKEVRTKGEFWAANNTSTYLGVIRRGAGGTGYIQIDRMRVVNQKHGSANNYMEVVGYNSNHVFGIDLWSSDKKLKENIVSLEDNHVELLNDDTSKTGLNLINNLNHYAYDYKKSFGGDHVTCGYVAQELQELNDSLVMEIEQQDGTTLLQPKASNIIPNLSLAIKQQQKMIDDLKAEIELLKSKLNN